MYFAKAMIMCWMPKIKIFPATLKDVALRWFMGLGRDNIHTWDQMMKKFLEKYQDYCKDKERREEVFRMMQHKDDSLEDYVKGSITICKGKGKDICL
jgi:hypothetical protein